MKFLFSILFALTLFSCRVSFVPAKDPIAIKNVQQVQRDINDLYNNIAASSNRAYTVYQPNYINIKTEIDSVSAYDQRRPKAALIIKQVIRLQSAFIEYEQEHKAKGQISAGEAMVYKSYLTSYIKTVLNSENTLK